MLLICKSILLLVSFLCHVIEIVHDTQKGIILQPFLRRAPKLQATHRKGNSPSNANITTGQTQTPSASEGSHHLQTFEMHNKAQLNTKDIYSQQGHSLPHNTEV